MALLELEKLRKDINILFGYVRCLMAKSDETSPLVATEWSSNHSTTTGNPYTIGTHVFYNGHVYKCLFNNDGIIPTNTTYWLDLGEGHLLAEEQSDWNATGGRRFILNKPDLDNKIIYFYPTLIELGVSTLEEVTETHIATWIQSQGIVIADDEVPLFKVQLSLTPVYFDPINRPVGSGGGWPEGQTFEPKVFYITEYVLIPGEGYWANVYEDKAGTTPFIGDNYKYRTPSEGPNPNSSCVYTITNLSKISGPTCRS